MSETKEECKQSQQNPGCPYITDIVKLKTDVSGIKTDISWLKKGYWIQVMFSIGTFLIVLSWIMSGGKI